MYSYGYIYPSISSDAGEPEPPPSETFYILATPDNDVIQTASGDNITYTPIS
jgi:hypothetical protein